MELILRSLQEDGVTPVNGDYTVIYYVSGVLTTVTDTGVSSITVSNVDDNSAVNVSVVSATRHTYNKIFSVYVLDLDLSVKLPTIITSIVGPNYLNPYPFFFTILNPCTYQIDVYNASSAPYGAGSWYLNNELFENAGGDVEVVLPYAAEYQIKRRVAVDEPYPGTGLAWDRYYSTGGTAVGSTSNTVAVNLALDTNTNVTYLEILPEMEIKVNSPSDILNGVTYYNLEDTLTINTLYTLTNTYIDQSIRVLNYEVLDPNNNRVTPTVETVNLDVVTPDTTTQFKLTVRGDYTVKALITDECGTHIVEKIIPAYNFVQTIPVEESEYEIRNSSNTITISYTVEFLEGLGFTTFKAATTIETKEADTLILSGQGVYKITYTFTDGEGNERTEIIILHYYGELKDCLTNLTMNILCTPMGGCGCDDISATGSLLEMYTLSQTYFMYLQEEYGFNNIYTALDNAKIAELADIDVVLRKLEKYCKTFSCSDNKPCSCGSCSSCTDGYATTLQIISGRTSSTTDCGCGGTSSGGCGCG